MSGPAGIADALSQPASSPGDGSARLQAALGNDDALLALARERVPLELKLAAVEALSSETALREAEHEFRDHDRRVHRLARQRHALAVARRHTRTKAGEIIESARALSEQPVIPANRLVEIDHAWKLLEPALVEASQRVEYEALMERNAALARERADQPMRVKRWTTQAQAGLTELRRASAEAASGERSRDELAVAILTARQFADAAPDEVRESPLHAELARAAALGDALRDRMAVLDAVFDADPQAAQRWSEAPPLGDADLDQRLHQRFLQWQQAAADARDARRQRQREEAQKRQLAARDERLRAVAMLVDGAEAALEAGHLAEAQRQLLEIERQAKGAGPAPALRGRVDALQARFAQLKGWQQWSGGRARDELVQQAEALAATAGAGTAADIKLTTRQRSELIEEMRARWKELDRLGGATNRKLWQRFEAALKAAYQPVAEQVAVQRAAREQNLQSRELLLERLEAAPLPEASVDGAPVDWRPQAAALEQFRVAWRKLGPIEHTVPHAARDRLMQRMEAATQRLEAPLAESRRASRAEREELVARARALGAQTPGRDLVPRARELQALWQQHAQGKPLSRADEQALWTEFKGAIDAAFAAREAAFNARDAELRAHAAERVAVIERLEAVAADAPAEQLKRSLAEADAAWRRAGPAPREDAGVLDTRFHRAREAVLRALGHSAQRGWQALCESLQAKLALCDELEASADADASRAAIEPRWSALRELPQLLEHAFRQRAGLDDAVAQGDHRPLPASTDELLLQIEAAWGLPSPPEFEAARRALKLQAMKAALETRRPTGPQATPRELFAELLRRSRPEAAQRARLDALLAALRLRGSFDAA